MHSSPTPARTTTPNAPMADPVDAARVAIWRLFEQGYVDEDMATAGLLAVDVGTRRRPVAGRPVATALSAEQTAKQLHAA